MVLTRAKSATKGRRATRNRPAPTAETPTRPVQQAATRRPLQRENAERTRDSSPRQRGTRPAVRDPAHQSNELDRVASRASRPFLTEPPQRNARPRPREDPTDRIEVVASVYGFPGHALSRHEDLEQPRLSPPRREETRHAAPGACDPSGTRYRLEEALAAAQGQRLRSVGLPQHNSRLYRWDKPASFFSAAPSKYGPPEHAPTPAYLHEIYPNGDRQGYLGPSPPHWTGGFSRDHTFRSGAITPSNRRNTYHSPVQPYIHAVCLPGVLHDSS